MEWLIVTYFLWIFTVLPNQLVDLWLRLGNSNRHQIIYTSCALDLQLFEENNRDIYPLIDRITCFMNHINEAYPREEELDWNRIEDQDEQENISETTQYPVPLSTSYTLVPEEIPSSDIFKLEKATDGSSQFTWTNVSLVIVLYYVLLLIVGAVKIFNYMVCLMTIRAVKGLLGEQAAFQALEGNSGSYQNDQQIVMALTEHGSVVERASHREQPEEEMELETIPGGAIDSEYEQAAEPKYEISVSAGVNPDTNSSVSSFVGRTVPLREENGQTTNMNFTNTVIPNSGDRKLETAATGHGDNMGIRKPEMYYDEPMGNPSIPDARIQRFSFPRVAGLRERELKTSSSCSSCSSMDMEKNLMSVGNFSRIQLHNYESSDSISINTECSLMRVQSSEDHIEYMDCTEESLGSDGSDLPLHLKFMDILKISPDENRSYPRMSNLDDDNWVSSIISCQKDYSRSPSPVLFKQQKNREAQLEHEKEKSMDLKFCPKVNDNANSQDKSPMVATHSMGFVPYAKSPKQFGSNAADSQLQISLKRKRSWSDLTDSDDDDDDMSRYSARDNYLLDTVGSSEADYLTSSSASSLRHIGSYYDSDLSTNTSSQPLTLWSTQPSTGSCNMFRLLPGKLALRTPSVGADVPVAYLPKDPKRKCHAAGRLLCSSLARGMQRKPVTTRSETLIEPKSPCKKPCTLHSRRSYDNVYGCRPPIATGPEVEVNRSSLFYRVSRMDFPIGSRQTTDRGADNNQKAEQRHFIDPDPVISGASNAGTERMAKPVMSMACLIPIDLSFVVCSKTDCSTQTETLEAAQQGPTLEKQAGQSLSAKEEPALAASSVSPSPKQSDTAIIPGRQSIKSSNILDNLESYIVGYQPCGRTGPLQSTSMQTTNNDKENPDGTVQITFYLPDGQPYTLNCNRLDNV